MFAFFLTFVAVGQALIGVAANTDAIIVITVGSSLHATGGQTSWLSPSGRFAFGFYPDGPGFSVGINMFVSLDKSLVIWTAAGHQGINPFSKDAVLSFTEQGILLTASNAAKAITLIEFNGTKLTVAYMLDSGNFIVNDSSHSSNTVMDCSPISAQIRSDPYLIWQSFDNPTDTMMGGQVLRCGTNLISRHSTTDHLFYQLSMQCDSNLVIYAIKKTMTADGNTTQDSYPIWASLTYKEGYDRLILSEGGHLFLSNLSNLNGTTYPLSPYGHKGGHEKMLYYAKQTPDKYFWLFALNLVTNKSTYLYEIPTLIDDCQRNSSCGMNSYCVPVTNGVHCKCLPSFNYTDSRAKSKGCQRSIAEPNCWPPGSSDTTAFSMEPVENLLWYDEAYSIVSADSKEDCSSICLSECDCEAAVFFNQKCSKYKLPMSRASIGSNISTGMRTTFIKTSAEGNGGMTEVDQRVKRRLMAVLLCGAIDAGVLLALLAAGAGSYWLFYGRYRLLWRKWGLAFQEEVAPRSFSFEELSNATNSFATELGRGGHAIVYMGYLTMYGKPNPVPVAVKRFNEEEGKGDSDFQAEIRIIGRAQHVNLVRLLGFCYEGSKRLLIYEYMNRGSLADLIRESPCPSWKQQVKILLGLARGLNYLHRECETKIIHRDIKPENILIAEKPENWVVKISDFGISKFSVEGHPATKRTSAPGTPGYVAPECVQSKGEDLTEKADVYSFGIVVLETVFWKRNTLDKLLRSASEYFQDINKKKLENVKLAEAELEMERMVQLGMSCVKENRDDRPYMEDVILRMLEWVAPALSVTAAVTPQSITTGKKVSWAPLVK